MDDAELSAAVQCLRAALASGDATAELPGGPTVVLHGQNLINAACIVHCGDVWQWATGGWDGPPPPPFTPPGHAGGEPSPPVGMGVDVVPVRLPHTTPQAEGCLDDLFVELQVRLGQAETRHTEVQLMPTVEPHLKPQPRDVARYRKDVAAWLDTDGERYYQDAVDSNRQGVFDDRPGMSRGGALAAAEAQNLRAAQLYFIDEDMCDLVAAAHPDMPDFAPQPEDLPAERGFCMFALPISSHHNRPWFDHGLLVRSPDGQEITDLNAVMHEEATQMFAVSWRPHNLSPGSPLWRKGGVWFTFYAVPLGKVIGRRGGALAELHRAQAQWLPEVAPENETVIAWYPGEGDDSHHRLRPGVGTSMWARIVLATFQLARQHNLSQTDVLQIPARPLPKAKARRTGRKQTEPEQVRVVRLRANVRTARDAQAPDDDGTDKARVYRHRWTVNGFWRNQWYPSMGAHRPVWIAPYLKGPAGAPLLTKKITVTVVSPPPAGAP